MFRRKISQKCRHIPNVDIIVAPYESDAQLAFLCESGAADFIITEDSDLVVFGAKTVRHSGSRDN